MEGGKRTSKSARKSTRKSTRKSSRRSSTGKVPSGYKGSIRPGDKLEFYWPQHGPVKTEVQSIRKTKNNRFQALGKSKSGVKLYQFVSGTE
jgi:hypothetical protein